MVEPLAQVLLEHWDVLGAADMDVAPEHEYIHEAGLLHDVLQRGGTAVDVERLLGELATSLHAPVDLGRDRRAAAAISVWYRGASA